MLFVLVTERVIYSEHVFIIRRSLLITRPGLVSRHEWKSFVLEGAGRV